LPVPRPASAPASLATAQSGARSATPAAARPRRISHRGSDAWKRCRRVASLQAQVAELNAELADPRRDVDDRKRIVAKTASLAAAHHELTAGDQWLTLELRREEIKSV